MNGSCMNVQVRRFCISFLAKLTLESSPLLVNVFHVGLRNLLSGEHFVTNITLGWHPVFGLMVFPWIELLFEMDGTDVFLEVGVKQECFVAMLACNFSSGYVVHFFHMYPHFRLGVEPFVTIVTLNVLLFVVDRLDVGHQTSLESEGLVAVLAYKVFLTLMDRSLVVLQLCLLAKLFFANVALEFFNPLMFDFDVVFQCHLLAENLVADVTL